MVDSDYYMIVYIVLLVISVVMMTLLLFISKKNFHMFRWMRNFSIVLLFYSVFETLLFYYVNLGMTGRIPLILMGLSNISYFIFIYIWIRVLEDSFGGYAVINNRLLLVLTVVYAVIVEAPGLFSNITGSKILLFFPNKEAYLSTVQILNLIFALFLIYIGIRYVIKGIQLLKRGIINKLQATFDLLFSLTFVFYIIWVIWWDYRFISSASFSLRNLLVVDPIVLIYIVLSIGFISYLHRNWLYKSDNINDSEELRNKVVNNLAVKYSLTEREKEVSDMILRGYSNAKIAGELYISEFTVKRHINNIFRKTGAKGRYELIAFKDVE